ncbi:MAG: hypothetical protein ACOYM9_20065 [Bradymonadia bacterium]|jgi:hypothetical protein
MRLMLAAIAVSFAACGSQPRPQPQSQPGAQVVLVGAITDFEPDVSFGRGSLEDSRGPTGRA